MKTDLLNILLMESGAKPLLLGSVDRSIEGNWKNLGSNIWEIQSNDIVSNKAISSDKIEFLA